MELNDLRIFQTVAAHGSVSKAAEQLSYVQSNVTARIKLLEKELGTPLFNRHKRGMVLNPEGKRLLELSRELLMKAEELKAAFRDRDNPAGHLTIGIVENIVGLPAILSAYVRKYANVELSLQAGVTEQLVQDVLHMKLDGAFVTGPVCHPSLAYKEVMREKLVFVTKEEAFGKEELASTPLLLYNKGCGYRELLEKWMRQEGIIPRQIMEFGTFHTIIGSVEAGIGMTILPESSISAELDKGTVHAHELPKPYGDITTIFVWRKDNWVTRTLQSFMDEMDR